MNENVKATQEITKALCCGCLIQLYAAFMTENLCPQLKY